MIRLCTHRALAAFAFVLSSQAGHIHAQSTVADPSPASKEFRPGELWPDNHGVHINAHGGGVLLERGIYYWFGEHKIAGRNGNTAQVGVHCYSSSDLDHWKDEGIALAVSHDPASDITAGCIIERPKVLSNALTGKFVMWFHLELRGHGYSAARCGVAVADKVTGPYTFLRSFRPDAGSWPVNVTPSEQVPGPLNRLARDFAGGQMARDLTLFADDDGKAYAVFASEDNSTLHISQLTDDYLGTTGRYARVLPEGFNEAPVIFKRAQKYYLITSGTSGWAPNAARSAVANHLFGPWKELGNPCRGTPEQNRTTFGSQGTFALATPGGNGDFVFMADRWHPDNPIDGRYVWLPIGWEDDAPVLRWPPDRKEP